MQTEELNLNRFIRTQIQVRLAADLFINISRKHLYYDKGPQDQDPHNNRFGIVTGKTIDSIIFIKEM